MKPSYRVRVHLLLAMALLLAATMITPVGAHPEGPGHHNPMPAHATATMRAFADDHEATYTGPGSRNVACTNGVAGTFKCSNVDLAAHMPLAEIGGTASGEKASDSWGWTDPLTGRDYAIIGLVFGTSFVDITTPTAPIYLGELPTHGAFGSSWRDIKVYADHAFIVSEASGHGMQVFDLRQLRNVSNAPVTFAETAHYNRISTAHNIAINEETGFAYIVGAAGKGSCSGGLHMVDIRMPRTPSAAGCFSADGYTHDTQCVIYRGPDPGYQGREICVNSNEDTITIVDVTIKSNPVQLSRTPYPESQYTHQGWLTASQRYFLLDDEMDEQRSGKNTRTRVFDVGNLASPKLAGEYFHPTTPAIDHNQYVVGDRVYQANYRAGLRILDITGVADGTLAEVGYFDVYPGSNAAQFNGAWSTYPYFASGNVVISGIEQGLFVVTPTGGAIGNRTWVDGGGAGPGDPGGDPPPAGMHVGDIDAATAALKGGKWRATVTVTVEDSAHAAISGAALSGSWSGGADGAASCITNADGQCSVAKTNIHRNSVAATFTVTDVAHGDHTYSAGLNHDDDGDSNGSTITVTKP